MIILQILVAVFVIGWFFGKRGKDTLEKQNRQFKLMLDQEIQNASDKKTVATLNRLRAFFGPSDGAFQAPSSPIATTATEQTPQAVAPIPELVAATQTTIKPPQTPIPSTDLKNYVDNTSLLLYFGAFLFITSVGLFIGFAEVAGGLKATLVALVAIVMYASGFWMYRNKKQLKFVGEAFIGIGMSTVPFIGITAYSFGNSQTNGTFIWLATSAVALGLYFYTILRLRSTFVSYLLIGSIVSLILSFAGVVDGPVYYYIWAAALTGIVMQIISINVASIPNLQEASKLSGQLFIPLSVIASLLAAGSDTNGLLQVAVTTALSAGYYSLLAVTESQNKTFYSVTAHVLTIIAVALGVFSTGESLTDTGISLLVVSLIHAMLLLTRKSWFNESPEHAVVVIGTSLITIVMLLGSPPIATAAIAMTVALGAILAYKYTLLFGLQIALGSLIALSYACGQWLPVNGLSATAQTILSLIFLLPIIYMLRISDSSEQQAWKESVRASIAIGLAISMGVALFSGAYQLLTISLVVSLLCFALYYLDKIVLWRQLEIAFAAVPLVYALFGFARNESSMYLSITTLVFLLVSIIASLRHRLLFARYASTAAWLLLPIALISDNVQGLAATTTNVIVLYGLVMIALSISRALALGKFLLRGRSNTAPLTSLTGHGSVMYYIAMLLAACVVVASSFIANNDTIGVLSLIVVIGYLVFHFQTVERSNAAVSLMPYWLQLVLLRFFEPYSSQILNVEIIYPLASCFVAITAYVYVHSLSTNTEKNEPVPLSDKKIVALSAVYIAPFSILYTSGDSWLMPFSAIIAVALTLFTYRDRAQHIRETIGGVLLLAVIWQLFYFGVTDIQIYAHMTAALLALYAFMRHKIAQESISDSYIAVALCAATIPLALEALSSGSSRGEALGLWLLFEQVGFLVLGVTIKKPLLTKWGLYVGIAAVLYQLRELGWAMVAVLSLFIIGVAIYRALKQPEEKETKDNQ